MALDQNDILAAWAESNAEAQAKLIDLMVGAALLRYGQTFVKIQAEEVLHVSENYEIERRMETGAWCIELRPRK